MARMLNPPHPGALLKEGLEALNVSARAFAERIKVSPSTVTRVMNEEGPITPVLAVKIAKAIPGPTAETWLEMQADYDARQAELSVDVSFIEPFATDMMAVTA